MMFAAVGGTKLTKYLNFAQVAVLWNIVAFLTLVIMVNWTDVSSPPPAPMYVLGLTGMIMEMAAYLVNSQIMTENCSPAQQVEHTGTVTTAFNTGRAISPIVSS